MKKLARNSIALATVAMLGAGLAGTAQAGSLAYSNLDILGIKFTDGNGNILVAGDTINVANFTNSTTNDATLDSVAGNDTNNSFGVQVCQGPACGGVGGFNEQAPIGTQHFARALSDLSGAVVDLGGGAGGATARTVGETQLIQNDKGIANSNIQLNAGFSFSLDQDTFVGFEFESDGAIHAMQNPDNNVPPSNAQASVNFTITIIDDNGALVFSWSPDGVDGNATMAVDDDQDGINLNDTLAAAFAGQDFTRSLAGSWSATSNGMLLAGVDYTLSINHTSDVQAIKEIPEPGSLALLGLGFAALGFRLRKA